MRRLNPLRLATITLLTMVFLTPPAIARVKLSSLPARDHVIVHLKHDGGALIEEERSVPLVAGANNIDFAWSNTRIQRDDVIFQVVDAPATVNVISVSHPPGENALLWKVWAEKPGTAKIRIIYRISGLETETRYRAMANAEENSLRLHQILQVRNSANESFDGVITFPSVTRPLNRPIEIDETRELLVHEYKAVTITKRYEADVASHGYLDEGKKQLRIPMLYALENTVENGLGRNGLPAGKIRLYQGSTNKTGSAFLGEDRNAYTPRGETRGIKVGIARDVIVKRHIHENSKEPVSGNLYHRNVVLRYEVENTKDQSIELDLVENLAAVRQELGLDGRAATEWVIGDQTTLKTAPLAEHTNADQITYRLRIGPGTIGGPPHRRTVLLHLQLRNEW